MPRVSGLEAARAILAAQAAAGLPQTPILALTASCSADEKARCQSAGRIGHVPKPCRPEHLLVVQAAVAAALAVQPPAADDGEGSHHDAGDACGCAGR